jgi:hypothetical protein
MNILSRIVVKNLTLIMLINKDFVKYLNNISTKNFCYFNSQPQQYHL